MKRKILLVNVIFLLMAGCTTQSATLAALQRTYTPEPCTYPTKEVEYGLTYPRVDGSTSTEPLQWMLFCVSYGLQCYWVSDTFGTREIQVARLADGEGTYTQVIGKDQLPPIEHSGTHEAYMKLINGEVDFILEARLPSEDELIAAQAKGVRLSIHPIALDALVFLANNANLVDGLTLDQVKQIYNGQIKNWKEVDGPDALITAYQREKNSGSQELMLSLVMTNTDMITGPEMVVVNKMTGPINALEGDSRLPGGDDGDGDGIAYTVYYYFEHIVGFNENIKVLAINGIRPTWLTIYNRTYPLVTSVYAVFLDNGDNLTGEKLLLDRLLSNQGGVVSRSGYVPLK